MSRFDPATGTETIQTEQSESIGAPLLEIRGLKKYFDTSSGMVDRLLGEGGVVKAVDGVDLDLRAGETLAVVGESGCGKSTLGQAILNLHEPTDGSVVYDGTEIAGLSSRKMRPYRRDLQMIFQDPLASLNPRQTVGEILIAPMEVHDIGTGKADRRERARELLENVGLESQHLDRYPHQFSGGQQQRIGIARALTLTPRVIVADEPVSALDVSVQAQILNLLEDIQAELGLSLMFITHDLSVVSQIADRVAVMYLGEIVEVAPVKELFRTPRHPYTKSLLSAVPRIDAADRSDRIILEGSVPSPLDPPGGCRFHTRCPEIIPSDDWQGDQSDFRDAFSFRTRLINDEIDIDAVRRRLDSEEASFDDEDVAAQVVSESFGRPADDLPLEVRTIALDMALDLVKGRRKEAIQTAKKEINSPCEQQSPAMIADGAAHAACLRISDTDDVGEDHIEY